MNDYVNMVFECSDLRKLIIFHKLKLEFRENLHKWMRDQIMDDIKNKWHRYCSCELCAQRARMEIMAI